MLLKKLTELDYVDLMRELSTPRLNGSSALKQVRLNLCSWLDNHHIPYRLHTYPLYPYFMEMGGAWTILTQLILCLAIWLDWGWITLPIVLISLTVIILETNGTHIVSRLISTLGENIVIEFEPQTAPQRQLIFTAHYDSKTEFFDHKQLRFFIRKVPIAMAAMIALGIIGLLSEWISSTILSTISLVLTLPVLLIFIPLALNSLFGRFAQPSQGSVDNGAACAILLGLANQLKADNELRLHETKVTVILFSGEEVAMQGSRAYVSQNNFPYPTHVINLELMGQNGAYAIRELIGNLFKTYPTDQELNELIETVTKKHLNQPITILKRPAATDSLPFCSAGIPNTTFYTLDKDLGTNGLHKPTDNLQRIIINKLPETVELLIEILKQTDQ